MQQWKPDKLINMAHSDRSELEGTQGSLMKAWVRLRVVTEDESYITVCNIIGGPGRIEKSFLEPELRLTQTQELSEKMG